MSAPATIERPRAAGGPRRDRDLEPLGPVYVFQLPVRVVHWAIFLCVVVLTFTGWWIGSGDLPRNGPITSMTWARRVHIGAGWVMLAAIVVRVIWSFTGNEWASWREWIPTTRKRFGEIFGVISFYLFLRPRYPDPGGGHNPVAGLSYTAVYAIFAFMFLSGIALERTGQPGDWHAWVAAPVLWIPVGTLRLLHHAGMWVIWTFIVVHICIATLIDHETRGNCFSAIFSGWRSRLRGDARP
jgi:Ni/Fe-hydrogenase 1 B-type cytochrome subunit